MSSASSWDRDDTFIKGKTGEDAEGDPIGKKITSEDDGDDHRLHVDAKITDISLNNFIALDNSLRYEDMNASRGGVARNTAITPTFTDIYSYTGSGYLLGTLVNVEDPTQNDPAKGWYIRIIIDGVDILEGSSGAFLDDFYESQVYDMEFSGNSRHPFGGIDISDHNAWRWQAPFSYPMRFNTSVAVQVRRAATDNKKFRAGFVTIIKE